MGAARWVCAAAVVASLGSAASVARADDSLQAEVMFREAKRLLDAGDVEHACKAFEESLRLDGGAAVGTRYNLAGCYEKQGRTASAWAMFLNAAVGAGKRGEKEREKSANDRAAALEPKLVRLRIVVSDGAKAASLKVFRDEGAVSEGQLGLPIPVDPGKHTVRATADGMQPFGAEVNVEGDGTTITVKVPALEPEGAVTPPPKTVGVVTTPTTPERSAQRPLGFVALGLGGALLVGGGVFLAMRQSTISDLDAVCGPDRKSCPADAASTVSSGHTYTTLSAVGFLGGAALVATGVVLVLTAKSSHDAATTGGVSVQVNGAGASLRATF
jgi:hypothetical protein